MSFYVEFVKETLIYCHFERSEKSNLLIYKDSSLHSEWQKWINQRLFKS